jgi:hypothetical protein
MRNDRRISPRNSPSTLSVFLDETPAQLFDISPKGLKIFSDKKLQLGSIVDITFVRKDSDEFMSLKTRIIWKKTFNGSGNTQHQYGAIFYQADRIAEDLFNRIQEMSKKTSERRAIERRSRQGTAISQENIRKFDRRTVPKASANIDELAKGIDRWRSFHTYFRPREFGFDGYNGKRVVMLGSNSYLNMANHPEVKEAAIKAIEKFGVGSGGVCANGGR